MLDLSGIDQKKLRPILDKLRQKIKKHPVVKRMFNEYGLDLSEIDLVPMAFANLDVSARTDHAIIYLNVALLNEINDNDHYLVHELVHFLQQTTGTKPTQSADVGTYLDNKDEIEGFQNQTEYIADEYGEDKADAYVDQLLDHHDIRDNKERKKRKNKLLELVADK